MTISLSQQFFIISFIMYIFCYSFYLLTSVGLIKKDIYLQIRRYLPCAIIAPLPILIAQYQYYSNFFILSCIIGFLWIITYPTLYFLTNHKNSTEFSFRLEPTMGLYLIAYFTSLKLLISQFPLIESIGLIIVTTLEFLILLLCLIQIIYYCLYKTCINQDTMMLLQETHYHEIIEFFKQFKATFCITIIGSIFSTYVLMLFLNIKSSPISKFNINQILLLFIIISFLSIYLWKKDNGVFVRTCIINLYLEIKQHYKNNKLYETNKELRLNNLEVIPSFPSFNKPSTFILVIGESCSRDYMSIFNNFGYNSTPWLLKQKNNINFTFFPHSYACMNTTGCALEKALTEFNQYNDKKFYSSCSIIDIAKKAGYTTYWYSNQGYLGDIGTPVTMIANTADTAKWTLQNSNKLKYDEALLDYLDELNPEKNNFVVIHLKGSHFNFANRYPDSFMKFSQHKNANNVLDYIDSIAYTDSILEKIFLYAKEKLNLQTMLFFSDHGEVPTRRRTPSFSSFGELRIPMFTYLSDEYIHKFKETHYTLKAHQNYYFTNDLIYELICGLLNIDSNHYDKNNSLSSPTYKYNIDNLLVMGNRSLKKDNCSMETHNWFKLK